MFEIYSNDSCRLEYIAGDVLEKSYENAVWLFITDDHGKSVQTCYELAEIIGKKADGEKVELCPLTLEIRVGNIVLKFGVCRIDADRDHYRFSGIPMSKLYLDKSGKFNVSAIQYSMCSVR